MIALLEAKSAGLCSRRHLANNLLAGTIVGIVALPLAMAFAIAAGTRPERGLHTTIVAAILTSSDHYPCDRKAGTSINTEKGNESVRPVCALSHIGMRVASFGYLMDEPRSVSYS